MNIFEVIYDIRLRRGLSENETKRDKISLIGQFLFNQNCARSGNHRVRNNDNSPVTTISPEILYEFD